MCIQMQSTSFLKKQTIPTQLKNQMKAKIKNLKFEKLCRICLAENEHLYFLFSSNKAIKYFNECVTDIKASPNDGLPQAICKKCYSILHKFHNFKKKIKKSYNVLQEYVINQETNNHLEENPSSTESFSAEPSPETVTTNVRKKVSKNFEIYTALATLKKELNNDKNCHICKKSFSCKGQLTRHLKTHIGIRAHVCVICGKSYMESGSLRKHFLAKHSDREKPHNCPECNQSFDLRSTLIRHIRTHTGEKPFGCEICHNFYPSKSYLNRHRKTHLGLRDKCFICEICSKSFYLKDALKAHLITHLNDRPYQCNDCNKSFSKKGLLQSHIKHIHTKEKNFMCQMCAKTFVTKSELNEHMRRHTGHKRKCSHVCTICNKSLSSASHLKLHIRSEHTGERPYQCNLCSKAFITSQSLKIHTRYHTGEKPYACKFCEKKFVTNESTKVHMRIHTGEKPYTCFVCGSAFSQNSTLKTHMKIHQ